MWVGRAGTLLSLGYGELTAADAYRCRLLCEAVSTDACRIWKEGDGSLTDKVVKAVKSAIPGSDFAIVKREIRAIEEMAWLVMAQGLMCIRAWYDAIAVLEEGLKNYPDNSLFKILLAKLKPALGKLKEELRAQGHDRATISMAMKRGRVDRVAYPWIVPEEFTRGTKAIKKVKVKFEAAATNASIAPSGLGGTTDDNYGVFAKCDINKGDQILLDKSIYSDFNIHNVNNCSACSCPLNGSNVTVDCCKAKFCTESCKTEALNAYHKILCGKDFTWLYDACKDTDSMTNEMIPLHMVKVLATAIQQNAKPLKVACVGTLKADYLKPVFSYFKLFDNIIAPTQVLQTLGVDIFTDMRFDSWALQTLFLRIENNKQSGRLGKRIHGGINPLFSMINHDCNPGATWYCPESAGAIEVAAIRAIKKGEEICVSYVDPRIPEAERRERIRAHVGKMCECGRCVQERDAAANGGKVDAFDVSKIVRDIADAQIAGQMRLAKKD